VTAGEHQRSLLQMISAVLRRPLAGPLLFGLVFGGGPFAVMFGLLDGAAAGYILYCMLVLMPIAIIVTSIGAVQTANKGWRSLLVRSFLTSAAACIPTPTVVWDVLDWRWGLGAFSAKDLAAAVYIFSLWAVAVALVSWPLALMYVRLQNRRARKTSLTTT
jgi:hypothetical protein